MASVSATSPSFVLVLAASPKTLSLFTSKLTLSPPPPPPPPPPLRPSHSQWRRSVRSASRKSTHLWRTRAASGAEATIEKAQQVIPAASDDGSVSTVVSALLFFAFVGLSILTIGVIYLAVQDFLQKREREKFEKEEAENKKKKGGKKGKVKARAGPRGFGQKIEEEEEKE